MTALILELKQGDSMILNGATIQFKNRARVELCTRSRFLFGKQIMAAEQATTPARRIYYELQTAYVGPEPERGAALFRARGLINNFVALNGSPMAREILGRILGLTETDGGFEALKLARQIVRHEASQMNEGERA